MQTHSSEIIIGIVVTIIIFVLISYFVIMLVAYTNQKKIRFIEEKEQLKSTFQKELLKTQLEVQEQTLTNISREIHDNITQVLSFVKLNLGMIENNDNGTHTKINESRE